MMSFSEDIGFMRSILARIASYSISLLDAGKPTCMACYILSLVGDLICKSIPTPIWRSAVHIKDPPVSVTLVHIRSG